MPRIPAPPERTTESPKKKINVLVYGADQMHYSLHSGNKLENENYIITFHNLGSSASPDFCDFDIVIIHYAVFLSSPRKPYEEELLKRKKQMVQFLKKKGTTTCFLTTNGNLTYKEDLIEDFLNRNEISTGPLSPPIDDFKINRSEFKPFLEKYGVAENILIFKNKDYTVLCSKEENILGVAIQSKIICLPYHFKDSSSGDRVKDFFFTLIDCILAYKAKAYYETPPWLSEFEFGVEMPIKKKFVSLQKSLEQSNLKIEKFERFKRILFLGDKDLKEAVKYTLEKGFGFSVEEDEKYIEDLWIKNKKGKRIVIIEVKGDNGNIGFPHINQLHTHRDRRDCPPTFPALLIMNTMMKAVTSVKDKDKKIHPDIVKHAKNNNILIIRTLDLLQSLDLVLSKKLRPSKFLANIKSVKGWLPSK